MRSVAPDCSLPQPENVEPRQCEPRVFVCSARRVDRGDQIGMKDNRADHQKGSHGVIPQIPYWTIPTLGLREGVIFWSTRSSRSAAIDSAAVYSFSSRRRSKGVHRWHAFGRTERPLTSAGDRAEPLHICFASLQGWQTIPLSAAATIACRSGLGLRLQIFASQGGGLPVRKSLGVLW